MRSINDRINRATVDQRGLYQSAGWAKGKILYRSIDAWAAYDALKRFTDSTCASPKR